MDALAVQAIAQIFALPILMMWGMPTSIMSCVGNVVFLPFLTSFIVISALIFITHIFCIPNDWLCFVLNNITHWWLYLLNFSSPTWLCAPACTPLNIISTVFFGAAGIYGLIYAPTQRTRYASLIGGAILCLAVPVFFTYGLFESSVHFDLVKKNKILQIDYTNSRLNLIDHGFFNVHASPEKVVNFTVRSALIKALGNRTIDSITLTRPSMRSFIGCSALLQCFTVKKVIIPFFKPFTSKGSWREYFKLKNSCTRLAIPIARHA